CNPSQLKSGIILHALRPKIRDNKITALNMKGLVIIITILSKDVFQRLVSL
ncbi:MAG: hypothetical protein ACI936_004339, partial [Paraglaciecola sp.]